jgi:hypothetical protein
MQRIKVRINNYLIIRPILEIPQFRSGLKSVYGRKRRGFYFFQKASETSKAGK